MPYRVCISGDDISIQIPIDNILIAQQVKSLLRSDKDDWVVSLLDEEDLK